MKNMSSNISNVDYNQDMAEWRPSRKDLATARALVHRHHSLAIRRRLALLNVLAATPRAPLAAIARTASTRTRVVRGLLQRWQSEGLSALTSFGRPNDLDAAGLKDLKTAIQSVPLRSSAEVADWLRQSKKLSFSRPTVRRYCRQLGFDLPARYKPPQPKKSQPLKRVWTVKQMADLKKFKSVLPKRIAAIERLGSAGAGSLNQVACACGVPASTLRLDVRRFLKDGAKAVVNHRRKENLLLRTGTWNAFVDWAQNQHQLTGGCPSAREARHYMIQAHGIRLSLRSTYTHLTRWHREVGIQLRRRVVREHHEPSEGLKVRAVQV
jgi:transposase